ncbi:hypothetical protein [Microbacterium telephonicum]|uniref:Uncharacterized protein n=1 Tax=Microbacterium telephonicum TaxID=1714841 RepID=A0A498C2S1_9MICO|nr:hypothetical protein [Microbacterium telephonicum]RLK49337.1 hypothetical protein C7474_1480 [Microbacterium telephonicum]
MAAVVIAGCAPAVPADSEQLSGGAGLTTEEAQHLEQAASAVQRTISCLVDRGWPVAETEGGWEISTLQESQVSSYEFDQAECQKESGLAGMAPLADTPDRLERLYDYELQLVQCLRNQGIDVPAPPSEQTFLELRLTDDAWAAYNSVDTSQYNRESWAELEAACPPYGSVG